MLLKCPNQHVYFSAKFSSEQELNQEKIKVEEKNTEILSSIEYARRIQTAILPPMKIV